MDVFSYLAAYLSLVLGLAVARVLAGLVELIQSRDRVQWYWLHVAWALFIVLATASQWWILVGWRDDVRFTFHFYLFLLISPFLLYVLAALVSPRIAHDERVDLERAFYRNRVWFFPILALLAATEYVATLLRSGFRTMGWGFTVFMAAAVAVVLSGAVAKGRRYHAALFIVVLVMWAAVWYLFGADVRYSRY